LEVGSSIVGATLGFIHILIDHFKVVITAVIHDLLELDGD
jgi:hypothetical protein